MKTFHEYDSQNPAVWEMFQRFTFAVIRSGHQRFSADLILHRIRWETSVAAKNARFKINNNFSADYARKFMRQFPQYNHFFEIRKRSHCAQARNGFSSVNDSR